MHSRQRLILLMLTMTTVSLLVAGITIGILYRTALRQTQVRLREIVKSQATLIESLTCNHCLPENKSITPEKTILNALETSYQKFAELEQNIGFSLAKSDNQQINFLLNYSDNNLKPIPPLSLEHPVADPINYALQGQSGVMLGRDFENVKVIVAYEPIKPLNWGLIAKIPTREIQAPFIKAGFLILIIALGVNTLGMGIIYAITSSLTQNLENVEQQLQQENQLVDLFLETVGSLVIVLNPEGKILRFNRTCEVITHYYEIEVVGQYFWDIFLLPDQIKGIKATFEELVNQKTPLCYENYWLTKTGERRYILWSNTILRHSDGQPKYVIGTGMDITEERKAKQDLQNLNRTLEKQVEERTEALKQEILRSNKIMETSPVGIVVLDRDCKIMMLNERSQQILGISPKQLADIDFFQIPNTQWTDHQGNAISSDDFPCQTVLKTGKSVYQFSCCLYWTDDIQIFLSLNASPLMDEKHQMTGIMITLEDVSERIQEQKEKLSQEARFRAIFDNSVLGIALVNHEQQIMQSNYALATILGYTSAELSYKHLKDFLSPENYSLYFQSTENSSLPVEKCLICKDGRKIWVNVFVYVILQQDSLIPLEVIMVEDITKRKEAQEIQNQLISRNEAFIQALGEIVYEHNLTENWLEWQGEYTKLLGYDQQTMGNTGESWLSRIHPDDLPQILNELNRDYSKNDLYDLEYRFRHQEGHYLWIHDRGVVLKEHNNKAEIVIGIFLDITKRKEKESELKATKDQLDTILSNISDGISVFDKDHQLIYVNAVLAKQSGYESPQEMLNDWNEQTLSNKFDLLDENGDPFPIDQLPVHLALKGQKTQPTIICFNFKNSQQSQWAIVQSSPVFDEQEKVKLAVTITHDITQLKQIEISLRESEERYRTIIETVNEGIVMLDEKGDIIFANDLFAKLLGYSLKEILGMSMFIFTDDQNREILRQSLEALSKRKGQQYDLELITSQGYTIWTNISSNPLLNEQGDYNGSLSLVTDISHRKLMEEALKESEEKLRAVLNAIQDSLLLIEPRGNILIANQTAAQRLGYPLEALLSSNLFTCLSPESMAEDWAKVNEAIYTGNLIQFEASRYNHQSQGIRETNNFIYPIKDEDNFIHRIAIFSQDITEKKQAEMALQESEERFRILLENIEEVLWINSDNLQEVLYISPAYETIWGRSCQSLYENGMSWLDAVHPADQPAQKLAVEKMKQMGIYEEEYRIIKPDQTIRWIFARANAIRDNKGKITRYVGIAQDITERKQILEDLEKANRTLSEWGQKLVQENQEMMQLEQVADFLQVCQTPEETYTTLGDLFKPLFPNCSGAVFLINETQTYYHAVSQWGQNLKTQEDFLPSQCWSLRQGHLYLGNKNQPKLFCSHITEHNLPQNSLCLPMMAQGKAIGLFYLNSDDDSELFNERMIQLAKKVAETLSLSLVNLQLREELHQKSIIDALTGLFNRYYLEESLKREIELSARKNYPLSVIMIDVDHFKRFNDTYGHEAGNLVLSTLGSFLKTHVRASDLACRYGGEELTLILPESSLEDATKRAEMLREGIQQLKVNFQGKPLGTITASFGVSTFPQHEITGEGLIQTADEALYKAKYTGRNRVVFYHQEGIDWD